MDSAWLADAEVISLGKTEFVLEEDAHVIGDCVKVLVITFDERTYLILCHNFSF